jgi:hypothetical protein
MASRTVTPASPAGRATIAAVVARVTKSVLRAKFDRIDRAVTTHGRVILDEVVGPSLTTNSRRNECYSAWKIDPC